MGHQVDLVITENGVASTYHSTVIAPHAKSQRELQIATPKKADGTMLDLVSQQGRPFLAVFEVSLQQHALIVAYPAYYISFSTQDPNMPMYIIKLEGSPKIIRKRSSTRIDRELELLFKVDKDEKTPFNTGRTINISTGGIKFRTSTLIRSKTITLYLNLDGGVLIIEGLIRGYDSHDYGTHTEYTYRIMFGDHSEETKAALEKSLGGGLSSDADIQE